MIFALRPQRRSLAFLIPNSCHLEFMIGWNCAVDSRGVDAICTFGVKFVLSGMSLKSACENLWNASVLVDKLKHLRGLPGTVPAVVLNIMLIIKCVLILENIILTSIIHQHKLSYMVSKGKRALHAFIINFKIQLITVIIWSLLEYPRTWLITKPSIPLLQYYALSQK